jgi:hypothetical protein
MTIEPTSADYRDAMLTALAIDRATTRRDAEGAAVLIAHADLPLVAASQPAIAAALFDQAKYGIRRVDRFLADILAALPEPPSQSMAAALAAVRAGSADDHAALTSAQLGIDARDLVQDQAVVLSMIDVDPLARQELHFHLIRRAMADQA